MRISQLNFELLRTHLNTMKSIASLLLLSAICLCGVLSESPKVVTVKEYNENNAAIPRIIGGIPAQAGQFPWQALIIGMSISEVFMCGGSIINETKILTAAHCVMYPEVQYQIFLGGLTTNMSETGRIVRSSSNYYTHPNYNPINLENDVGIIELDSPLEFTTNIQPVKLPVQGQQVGEGVLVRVSGWGIAVNNTNITSSVLNWVNLTTISNTACQTVYGNLIQSSTLCAVGAPYESTCSGDSGGALVSIDSNGTATHVGVVSFVSSAGCGVGHPSGYVRTEPMLDFINGGDGILISKILLGAMVLLKILLR